MVATTPIQWKIGSTDAPPPPKVKGLPFLGNALQLNADLARFMVEAYQEYGAAFRIGIPGSEINVLAGKEANQFTTQHDEEVFTNTIEFAGLSNEVGPVFTAQESEAHQYGRRLLKSSYSKARVTSQLDVLIGVVDRFVDGLNVGDSFEVFPTMQRIVLDQLGTTLLGSPPGDTFDDFRVFMKTMLQVYIYGTRPKFVLNLPAYRNAKARSFAMAQRIVDHMRNTDATPENRTNIHVLMENVDHKGNPYGEDALLAEALGPYLAGQDTVAGTLTFLCYTMHKYPDVNARVHEELRNLWRPDMSYNEMRKLDVLHRAIVETMRRYPVAPTMPRHASQDFEFAGYGIHAGERVYCATAVTHFLPEYYPDPFTFNIDRERGASGTFVPYGVGNYACLGASIADVQLMVTMAALLSRARFSLDPTDYEAKLQSMPLPNPGRYRLKLIEKF